MNDGRSTFGNDRVAETALKGSLQAQVYREPTRLQIATPVADVTDPTGHRLERQFLLGEAVDVLEPDASSSLTRSAYSGYVGRVAQDSASIAGWMEPTAIVTAPTTFLFDADDFKAPNPRQISMGSCLTLVGETQRFFETHLGNFVPKGHVHPLDTPLNDPLSLLQGLIGVPYLWGGNSGFGIDCSGLVQMMMRLAGSPCPGDSDQQARDLGGSIPMDAPARRGDLWFWKGHVALSWDADTLIHANAHHMAVVFEDLQDAITRIADQGDGPVTGRRRL